MGVRSGCSISNFSQPIKRAAVMKIDFMSRVPSQLAFPEALYSDQSKKFTRSGMSILPGLLTTKRPCGVVLLTHPQGISLFCIGVTLAKSISGGASIGFVSMNSPFFFECKEGFEKYGLSICFVLREVSGYFHDRTSWKVPNVINDSLYEWLSHVSIDSLFDTHKSFIFFIGPVNRKAGSVCYFHVGSIRFADNRVKHIDRDTMRVYY